jgi:nitrate reductase assembly molybdenum cofactor insertion protein NarJ
MDSTLDLLQRATIRLSQEGSIKDRLADAYASHLLDVDADELPDGVRLDFAALCEAMHRERPLPRESVIRASVRKMSNDEAVRYAALVVRVFATVARTEAAGIAVRRSLRVSAATPVVQLFAAEG